MKNETVSDAVFNPRVVSRNSPSTVTAVPAIGNTR